MSDNALQIGPPAPEVIIGIDARYPGRPSSFLEGRDLRSNLPGLCKEFLSARELEVVDHIDEQQTGVMRIRCTPMQIMLRSRLDFHAPNLQPRPGDDGEHAPVLPLPPSCKL
jgi:hypothetical protein